MVTISAVGLKSKKMKDRPYDVNTRIWHKDKPKYIPAEHWVNK